MRKTSMLLLALLGLTACDRGAPGLAGSRNVTFGNAKLATVYLHSAEGELAWLHVLFVPDREQKAGGGFGSGMWNGGTVEHYELQYEYGETGGITIKSHPVVVKNADVVQSGNRSFSLKDGNIFLARVHDDGAVDLSQVRLALRERGVTPEAVLRVIKASAPADRRVQSLEEFR